MNVVTPGIMIAAAGSGCGKTTITCSLMNNLKNNGLNVAAYKCGPDYIDPMYHRQVIGVTSYNIDSFFSDEEMLKRLYAEGAEEADICIAEGVMGLYDGISVDSLAGSSYQIAGILGLPIILVVDAGGMGRSVLAHISGYLSFDKEQIIQGIILNNISEGFYNIIAPVIERELNISVLGFLPKDDKLNIGSRHLGLHLPGEVLDLKERLDYASEILGKYCNIPDLIDISSKAKVFTLQSLNTKHAEEYDSVKIAVARDEAFCFYYEENMQTLRDLGAEIVYFSPIHDKELPKGAQGLILGGGYPENYGKELENNKSMRSCIRRAVEHGMPSLAECGGFMYLHNSIKTSEGIIYEMCGALDADCFYTGRLVRFGYISIYDKIPVMLKEGECIKGHEFHYFDSTYNGNNCTAVKPTGGRKWDCAIERPGSFWGFPHLYYPSNTEFAENFLKSARNAEPFQP